MDSRLFIFSIFSIFFHLARACFTPRDIPDTPPTTTAPPTKCRDCIFESLLKPVTGEFNILPKNYKNTTTENGCTGIITACSNDDAFFCDYQVINLKIGSYDPVVTQATNGSTGAEEVIATKDGDIAIIVNFTCNDSGVFDFNGFSFDSLHCTQKNCQ